MNKKTEAAGFAASGGAVGAGISAVIGNMGLAGSFGAVAVGVTPLVGAGMVTGLALYGIKKALDK